MPYEPFVDLLNSPVWTDRNKSSIALMDISSTRDPRLLSLLADAGLRTFSVAGDVLAPVTEPFQPATTVDYVAVRGAPALPGGWSILYHLGRLEHDELELLVREGIIHPGLTLAEARKLTRRRRLGNARSKRPPVNAWMRDLAAFVEATHDAWSIEQRKLAGATLREILLRIELALANSAAFQSITSLACSHQPLENAA